MSALGSFVGGMFNLAGQHASFEQQKQLLEQQNQYNLEMWNMQNEYNSPAAQMRRFEEAGLNSALMYGQVNPGNATAAPVKKTPDAIKYENSMRDLAQAFNIVELKKEIASMRKEEADATIAGVEAANRKDEREAMSDVSLLYDIDPSTGRYTWRNSDVTVLGEPTRQQRLLKNRTGAYSTRAYHFNKELERNFHNTFLLQPRESLIQSQRDLNYTRGKLIAPQAVMRSYDSNYYPFSFWFDRAVKGAQLVRSFLPY